MVSWVAGESREWVGVAGMEGGGMLLVFRCSGCSRHGSYFYSLLLFLAKEAGPVRLCSAGTYRISERDVHEEKL